MNKLYLYTIAVLLGLIIYLILSAPNVEPKEVDVYEKQIQALSLKFDSLDNAGSIKISQLRKDSTLVSDSLQRLKSALKRMEVKKSEISLKTANSHELDSIVSSAGMFIITSDSTHCFPLDIARVLVEDYQRLPIEQGMRVNLEEQVGILERDKVRNWKEFNQILSDEQEKTKVALEMSEVNLSLVEVYKAENRKLKRGNKILKVVAIVSFGLGIIIAK